ncbi:MAG: hypothetical protein IJ521_08675, partial [Schwartzia sp.]|nr:hypothetical protein [Schwartzia sp. (in: firmicutes)]
GLPLCNRSASPSNGGDSGIAYQPASASGSQANFPRASPSGSQLPRLSGSAPRKVLFLLIAIFIMIAYHSTTLKFMQDKNLRETMQSWFSVPLCLHNLHDVLLGPSLHKS